MDFYLGPTYINITEGNIHIHNSYLINTNSEKQAILNEIFSLVPEFPRTYKSALREWKAHNILYKLHILRKSTMHTDIEAKQNILVKFGYFIINLFSFLE